MAGTITHYFFAKDVMNKLNKEKKFLFNYDYLGVFAQNMDPFNFYSIYFPILKGSFRKREFADYFHNNKIDEFFETLFKYVKDNRLYEDIQVSSFIYGMITHYVLDSSIHPFVEYKCGSLDKKNKATYKYNAKHHEMETYLDIYMLEKNGFNHKKYKSYKEVFKTFTFNDNLINVLNYCFNKVYGINNFSKIYSKSINDMKISFRLFRYDPFGIKKRMYYIFDFFTPKYILNSKFLSYSYIPKNYNYFLNNENEAWHYPYDNSITYNYSFDKIYSNSVNDCIKKCKFIHEYFYNDKKIDIKKFFNLSYCTGISWDKKLGNPIYFY